MLCKVVFIPAASQRTYYHNIRNLPVLRVTS